MDQAGRLAGLSSGGSWDAAQHAQTAAAAGAEAATGRAAQVSRKRSQLHQKQASGACRGQEGLNARLQVGG